MRPGPALPVAAIVACVSCLAASPRVAGAQSGRFATYPELRADVIASSHTQTTVGAGLELPFGAYVRLGLDASAGAVWHDGSALVGGRADAIARFVLDPFREIPVGLSLGAGVTLPVEQRAGTTRPLLAAVVDLEGRRRGAWTPALQIGLGGGVRLGFAIRRSPRGMR